jgi:hypothetical protein
MCVGTHSDAGAGSGECSLTVGLLEIEPKGVGPGEIGSREMGSWIVDLLQVAWRRLDLLGRGSRGIDSSEMRGGLEDLFLFRLGPGRVFGIALEAVCGGW